VIFILGKSSNIGEILSVRNESEKYGDILELSVGEGWGKIVLKTVSFIDWAAEFCPQFRFLAKFDTDTFPHLPSIFRALDSFYLKQELSKLNSNHSLSPSVLPVNLSGEGDFPLRLSAFPLMFGWIFRPKHSGPRKNQIPLSKCCGPDVYPEYLSGGTSLIIYSQEKWLINFFVLILIRIL